MAVHKLHDNMGPQTAHRAIDLFRCLPALLYHRMLFTRVLCSFNAALVAVTEFGTLARDADDGKRIAESATIFRKLYVRQSMFRQNENKSKKKRMKRR